MRRSRACRNPGVRAVFAYGNPQNETGAHGNATGSKYPDDIARLRKQYFSSEDQLLTLYLAAPGGVARADPGSIQGRPRRRRAHHHPCRRRRVRPQRAAGEAQRPEALKRTDTTYIHCCTLNDTEWKLIKDTGGTISIAGYVETLMGHGNPPTQKAIDTGIRPSLSVDVETSVPNDFFTADAHRVLAAEERGLGAAARRRQESAEVPDRARRARIRHRRRRARQRSSSARSARSRPARTPTSSCCAPTGSTSCR